MDPPYNVMENCVGLSLYESVPNFKDSNSDILFLNILKTGKPDYYNEYAYDHYKRGVTYWDGSVVPIFFSGKIKYIFQTATEITEKIKNRNLMEEQAKIIQYQKEQLEEELKYSTLLQKMSTELLLEEDKGILNNNLLDIVSDLMDSQFASLQIFYKGHESDGVLRLLAHKGFNKKAEAFWECVNVSSGSVCGEALRKRERIIVKDIYDSTFLAGTDDLDIIVDAGICSVQSTPLVSANGALVGMISTHWRKPYMPTERQLRYLDMLARQAADLIERKKAEEALKESDTRFRVAVMNSSIVLSQFDQDVKYIWIHNPHPDFDASQVVGKRDDELENSKAVQLLGDLKRQVVENGKGVREEITFYRSDGAHTYDMIIEPIYNDAGVVIGGTSCAVDITERKKIEEKQRESEERFRAVQDNSLDRFTLLKPFYNDVGEIVDFIYIYQNAQAAKTTGRSPEELVGHRITEFFPSITQARFFAMCKQAVETGKPLEFEHYYNAERIDEWFHTKVTLVPDGIAVATQIITERKQTEEALAVAYKQIQDIIDNTPDIIYALDLEERFVMANKALAQLFDSTPEQLMGKRRHEFMPMEDADWHETNDRNAIKENRALEFEEYSQLKGRSITWLTKKFPLRDTQGRIYAVAGISADITERKRMEMALIQKEENSRKLSEELLEADRRKNEFLSVLSHELRNPMATIMMSLSMLNRKASADEQTGNLMDIINRQSAQLARLIDDLLDITRITRVSVQLKKETVELNKLIADVIRDHRTIFEEKEITLDLKLIPNTILMEADPARLKQIIGNLLHNAAKFTLDGGKTVVTLGQDKDRNEAIICVKDNGIGISSEMLPHIFEPFKQDDNSLARSGGGLGLGLSIVKSMVELHGGSVEAMSDGMGKGSEFAIRLPLPVIVIKEIDRQISEDCDSSRPLRILIIDDRIDLVETVAALLETLGHIVATAFSGIEGLQKANEFHPDVILCDIGLPDIDGYEVARTIRGSSEFKDTYLIAVSGYALPADIKRAMDVGFNRHIAKPVDITVLQKILETETK